MKMKKQENNLKIINEKTLPISRKAVPELQLGLGPGAQLTQETHLSLLHEVYA
jgi:hypothetical protein